jgi:hypothetical protein
MVALKSRIVVTSRLTGTVIEFDFCTDITIKSSWQDMTDTATVKFPRKLSFEGKEIFGGANPLIRRGDSIDIYLGYDPFEVLEFSGFISDVNPKLPIELICQNSMWLFKQFRINKIFPTGTALKTIVTYIIDQYKASSIYADFKRDIKIEVLNTNLGEFKIENSTPVDFFSELEKEYPFTTFMRNDTIYCGLAYYPNQRNDVKFAFQDTIISSDMEYRNKEDVRIQVIATSINVVEKARAVGTKNVRTSVTVGDPDGGTRPFHYVGLNTTELTAIANTELNRLKYTGFYGGFSTFGEFSIKHGDGAIIVDDVLPEKNGTYLIKGVEKTFGLGGYRQNIELDIKIA